MNAVKIAVLNGGKVSQVLELEPGRAPHNVTVRAAKGSRFVVMGSDGEPAPQPIQARRIGRNLLVDLESEGVSLPSLIIEDFDVMQAELIGKDDDGTYHAYVQQEDTDLDAADLVDGGDMELVLAADTVADGGALGEALAGAGAAAGLSGLAWAGLAGLGAAGIGAVLANDRKQGGTDTGDMPPSPAPVPVDASPSPALVPGDTSPRPAPVPGKATVLVGVHDDVGTQQGLIEAGAVTDDRTPTFKGMGTPGNTVEILDGGTLIGKAVVQADGHWNWTPVTPLAEGAHSMTFRQVDGAGNVSVDSQSFDFIVDITAPGKGEMGGAHQVAVWDDMGAQQGAIPDGGRTDDDRPELRGMAEPGATIEVYDNGVRLGAVTAGADGQWSFTPTMALSAGQHAFTVVVVDGAGNSSLPSDPWTIVVGVDRPQVGGVWEDSTGVPKQVLPGQPIKDATPIIGGGGVDPGDTVVVIKDGQDVGTVIADGEGNWTWTPGSDLSDGEHTLEFVIEDGLGNRSQASEPVLIIVDTTPPAAPGFSLGNIGYGSDGAFQPIGSHGHTKDTTPMFAGDGQEPGDKVILRDANTREIIGEAIVTAAGKWKIVPDTALPQREHTFELVIEDKAGNQSAPSAPVTVIVDITAPDAPGFGIGNIQDDSTGTPQPIGSGGHTRDTTPVFTGNGQEPGDRVILRDKNTGVSIGEAIVAADGTWEIIPGTALAQGEHTFELVVEDKAGNQSMPSAPVTVIVDSVAPTATVSIDSMTKDSGNNGDFRTNDGSAGRTVEGRITGALNSGERVMVSVDGGQTWQAATINGDRWSMMDNSSHGESWEILVRVVDTLGNAGNVASQVVILDELPPSAPTSVSWDGDTIAVEFDAQDGGAPRAMEFVIDGASFTIMLTPAQISAGRVDVVWSSVHDGNFGVVKVRMTDESGNASGYHELTQMYRETARADMYDQWARWFDDGEVVRFDGFELKVHSSGDTRLSGFGGTTGGVGTSGPSMALMLGQKPDIDLVLDEAANTFSFNYGDLDAHESLELSFYDSNGNEIYRHTISRDAGDVSAGPMTISIPYGHGSFSTIKITSSLAYDDEFIWIDDIVVSAVEYVETAGSSVLDAAHQFNDVTGLDGGGDSDSMQLNGADPVLDRSLMNSPSWSSAIVDFTGDGDNTLNLSLNDVLQYGGMDMFIEDSTTQMMINGDAGDSVELSDLVDGLDDGDWAQQSGTVTVEGAQYAVYVHSSSNAELLVQSGVQVHLDNH